MDCAGINAQQGHKLLTSARLYCSCAEFKRKVKRERARMCLRIDDPETLDWKCTLHNAHPIPALEAPGAAAAAQLPSAVTHSEADPQNTFPSMITCGIQLRQAIQYYKVFYDRDIAPDEAAFNRVSNYWHGLVKDSKCGTLRIPCVSSLHEYKTRSLHAGPYCTPLPVYSHIRHPLRA